MTPKWPGKFTQRAKNDPKAGKRPGREFSHFPKSRLLLLFFRLTFRASLGSPTFRAATAKALAHPFEHRLDLTFVELAVAVDVDSVEVFLHPLRSFLLANLAVA